MVVGFPVGFSAVRLKRVMFDGGDSAYFAVDLRVSVREEEELRLINEIIMQEMN